MLESQDDENIYLLLEYCAKGELYQILKQGSQVARGLPRAAGDRRWWVFGSNGGLEMEAKWVKTLGTSFWDEPSTMR